MIRQTKMTGTHEVSVLAGKIGDKSFASVNTRKLRNGVPFGPSRTRQYATAKDALYAYYGAK